VVCLGFPCSLLVLAGLAVKPRPSTAMTAVRPMPDSEATPSRNGKVMKKPQRPDFAARDEVLGKLQEKVQEFSTKAKTAASELDALQNEAKTNSKMEACRRGLANTVHTKTQTKVRVARSCQR
jgi:hypothetical protein